MLRTLVFCVVQTPLALLATGVLSVVGWLVGLIEPRATRAVALFWGRLVLRLVRVRVVCEGFAQLPHGPAVYAANHSSVLDILVVLAYLPVDVKIIHKKSLSRVPLFGWSLATLGHIPIDRSNPFRAQRSLEAAAARIHNGTSVLVFPEGTRSRDGSVGPFKRGSFALAIASGAPVVPMSLVGVKALAPRGIFSTRPGSVRLVVHPAIPMAGKTKDDAQALADQVRQVVAAGCGEEVRE